MIALVLTALLLVSFAILILTAHLSTRFSTDIVGGIVACVFVVHATVALLVFEIIPAEYKYLDTLGPFGFSYGPLFYFSIRPLAKNKKIFYRKLVLHGIPFFGATLFYLTYASSSSLREYLGSGVIPVWYLLLCVSWFVYLLSCVVLFVRQKVDKRVYQVSTQAFVFFCVVVSFIAIVLFSNGNNSEIYVSSRGSLVVFTFMLIHSLLWYNYLLGRFKDEKAEQAFEQFSFSSKILDRLEEDSWKKHPEEKQHLGVHLILAEQEEGGNLLPKIDFLDSEKTLAKQAALFDMKPADLSRVIREETGMTYTNYINKQRIDHAVSLLVKDKNIDMDELMQASGFSSKSSFYRNFKKFTDHSPLEYIQQVLK